MYAILITGDGRGGSFHMSPHGDPLVAVTNGEKRELEDIIRCDYPETGQLVDLGTGWRHSVTTVDQLNARYKRPAWVVELDSAA
jgi:hypothetical protein